MRDELVNLESAVHVIFHEIAHLRAALDAAEGAAFPSAAGDELEGWNGMLVGDEFKVERVMRDAYVVC